MNPISPEWVLAITTVGMAFIGLIIWLVRLEGKVKTAANDIDKIEKQQNDVFEKIFDKLSVIEINLAKMEGKLSSTQSQN